MPYVLQPMIRIRQRREDAAGAALVVARTEERAAAKTLEERKEELAEYERTKEERRDRVYDAVMGRPCTMDDLDKAREGVARIDEEGILKADNVSRAEGALHEKQEASAAAQSALNLAIKNRMKIEEHRAAWVEEDRLDQERHAEFELEDFTGRKQDD
ncbi:MAG: YscO family type III secretion system apparatus protein [Kiritimatiellae bacterium]|nr:YscO family type III secretion system apparatus protein [Kiritimatiellia bacterium]MBQ6247709.1 YscO family type III secretion system apparatus protein [Kiritimatiellia bacterium]